MAEAAPAAPAPHPSDVLVGHLGLQIPEALGRFVDDPPDDPALADLIYRVVTPAHEPPSLGWAFSVLRRATQRPPLELVPVAPVDDRSLACVVCGRVGRPLPSDFGTVVRWHLDDIPIHAQRALLDGDLDNYIETYRTEVTTREEGLRRFDEQVSAYHAAHGQKTPRAHHPRPVRKACQNVVIGQGCWHHDGAFNGLDVTEWQTCQVPHVGAHEGNRGLLASTLAEAFRAGGTMEVRFDAHLEHAVPASLRQYGRTVGCEPGRVDPRAIVPAEARELMLALTPMPAGLRAAVAEVVARGILTPERVCYLLLAGTWRPIELELLLRTSPRALSILAGGADPLDRVTRQAELALGRAAVMVGMLHARLSLPAEAAGNDGRAIVLEDERRDVSWTIDGATATVRFEGAALCSDGPPWDGPDCGSSLIVAPRSYASAADLELIHDLERVAPAALVVPADATAPHTGERVAVMHCPERISALDRLVEGRLNAARVGRV